MRLFGSNGLSFDLVIDGYQFPECADKDRDSNWLCVRGEVRYSGGGWSFRLPCLETFEVRALADWLYSVARGKPRAPMCSFIEPALSLEYQSDPERAVVIRFARASAPPWQARDERLPAFALAFDLV